MRRIAMIVAAVCAVIALAIGVGRRMPEEDAAGAAPAAAESGYAAAGRRAGEDAAASGGVEARPAPAPDASSAVETAGRGASETTAAPGGDAPARPRDGAQPGQPADAAPGAETSGARDTPQADAAAILRRASLAYARVNTMAAEFTQRLRNRLLRTDVRSKGRLYQRHPDRFLMRFEDPAGDVIVSDGRHFWVYYPSVDSLQVMRAPAGEQGSTGVDLRSQFVGNPLERFDATLDGREAVGGRDAYVLTLVPKQPQGYERLRIWVDDRDYLVRRFEITEENGNVRLIELHGLEINQPLDEELFRFTPPPNAHIVERG
ncbi:MAG TPA: outer-membrane lipoprotein carrier protein LolA [Longimicrobiales bacterium]